MIDHMFGADWMFWPSVRAGEVSVWHGHVAFAHWIVSAMKPRSIVELGTHNAVSYFSFCNAADRLNLECAATAIDCWEGDPQAGFYDDSVYASVSRFNEERYPKFSSLKKNYFDDVVNDFEDGSIDLLHIDGLHTYEAVKHDYETWNKKVSSRGVILFHDTNIIRPDFGVRQLWLELMETKKGFNFLHSAGLGVLAYGADLPEDVKFLCSIPDASPDAQKVRGRFEMLSQIAHASGLHQNAHALPNAPHGAVITTGPNIALHCRATQSSFSETRSETPQGAVNGIKNGRYGFHTAYEHQPWWQLDLGAPAAFDEIRIYNRLDPPCASRSRQLDIAISNDGLNWNEVYSHDGRVFGGIDGHPLSFVQKSMTARYIRLKLRDENFLHLDEVEVYAHID